MPIGDIAYVDVSTATVGINSPFQHLSNTSTVPGPSTPREPCAAARQVRALLGDPLQSVVFRTVADKFEALATEWRRYNRGRSVINYAHPAYFQVVALGELAIPLLLHEVAQGAGTWYPALQYITGEMPYSPRGSAEAARRVWLEWGRRNGHWGESDSPPAND